MKFELLYATLKAFNFEYQNYFRDSLYYLKKNLDDNTYPYHSSLYKNVKYWKVCLTPNSRA